MSPRTPLRVPPGRAGRRWLRHRLHTAERGLDLLERKLRILRAERERLAQLAERTEADWTRACTEAETWLLRAALLGGQQSLRLAASEQPAEVTVTWKDTMGIHHPDEATCHLPDDPTGPPLADSSAVTEAWRAHRSALTAVVHHAAATAAARAVAEELTATSYRRRAIEDRWIPRLREALAEVELGLEEQEHADGARLRRAAHHG